MKVVLYFRMHEVRWSIADPDLDALRARFPGVEFVRHAAASTALPAYPIGGIDAENVRQILAAGATRVCVGRAITASADPARVVRSLLGALGVA